LCVHIHLQDRELVKDTIQTLLLSERHTHENKVQKAAAVDDDRDESNTGSATTSSAESLSDLQQKQK
jgi:hypothetical protein